MNNNAMMLIFISKYNNSNVEEKEYIFENKGYCGIQTSDAPTLCLLNNADKDGKQLKKIICIVSREVFEDKVVLDEDTGEKITEYENYQRFIKREYKKELEFIPVYYDFDPISKSDVKDTALHIYHQITEILQKENQSDGLSVYVDYTSGLRDVSFLMTSIIRYMEFYNIKLEKIIYSNNGNGKISEIGYIYDMYTLINGVSEFVNTGNANQLKMFYQKEKEVSENELSQEISDVIESIIQFSETVSLCSLSQLEDAIENVKISIKKLNDCNKNVGFYTQIFMTLLPLIKEKLYFTEEEFNYPQLIHWCLDNRMLQQAITVYTEKMPVYYFQKNYVVKEIVDLEKVDFRAQDSSKEASGFYNELYNWCLKDEENLYDKVKKCIFEVWEKVDAEEQKERQFLSELNILIENNSDEKVKDGLRQFEKIVKSYINHKKPEVILKNNESIIITQKSLQRFMNYLNGNSIKDELYALIYKKKPDKPDKSGTYNKKIRAIENLINGKVKVKDAEKLVHIMKYYLAVKLIRNRVNHASEKDISEDENKAIKKMKDYGITIDMNFENIKNILLQGIQEG